MIKLPTNKFARQEILDLLQKWGTENVNAGTIITTLNIKAPPRRKNSIIIQRNGK